jgi:hypothetical protein
MLTEGAAPADWEAAEAEEGHGKGHDVGGEVADDHDLVGVWWDEFRRHVLSLSRKGDCSG